MSVSSGLGGYKSILGDRLGLTQDNRLVVGGQVVGVEGQMGAGVPYFCDPANGDNNLSGKTPGTAVASLVTALGLTTAAQNDVVVLIGDGATTGTARLTATLDWAKNAVHLIGVGAGVLENKRTRISHAAAAVTNLSPMITVSAAGCLFADFNAFQGTGESAKDEELMEVTGSRNYFVNVGLQGIAAAAGAARAGSNDLLITGGGENTWRNCLIGIETIQRSAANAVVRVRSLAQRNRFESCEFVMAASATSPIFVDVDEQNALNGSSLIFKDCFFRNLINVSSAADPAVVCTYDSANVNGTIYFINCVMNATKWAAAGAEVQIGSTSAATIDGFDSGGTGNAADA